MDDSRTEWIRSVIAEQAERISRGKERKLRFGGDGSIGSKRPPDIKMVSELSQTISSLKRGSGQDVAISRARAVSDNANIGAYKASVKVLHDLIEEETEVASSRASYESARIRDSETVGRALIDVEDRISSALEVSRSTTNATAKGKSLSTVRDLSVLLRKESCKLLTISGRVQTDIAVSWKRPKRAGVVMTGGFHADDNPFCFGDCL